MTEDINWLTSVKKIILDQITTTSVVLVMFKVMSVLQDCYGYFKLIDVNVYRS